jgi:hypothetical protein
VELGETRTGPIASISRFLRLSAGLPYHTASKLAPRQTAIARPHVHKSSDPSAIATMEGACRKRRRSPSPNNNHSNADNSDSSSSNTMTDSATSTAATVQPFPAHTDNGDPARAACTSDVFGLHSRITVPSSLTLPRVSAHQSDNSMQGLHGDNQLPLQNPIAIDSILSNSPHPNDLSSSSNDVDFSTINGEQIGSKARAREAMTSKAV